MTKRSIGSLILAASLITGCAGGGGSTPTAKSSALKGTKAIAFVHITWPMRSSSTVGRSAKFISTSATRIEVVNTNGPAGSNTVEIPQGTQTAQIPAVLGDNNYTFTEYDGPSNLSNNTLATAIGYTSISDPTVPAIVDALLSTNNSNMGVAVSSTDAAAIPTPCTIGSPCLQNVVLNSSHSTFTDGSLFLGGSGPQTFTLYLQPTDVDHVIITGAGVPAVTLSPQNPGDPNVVLTRLTSDASGAFANYPKYSVSFPNGFLSCPSYTLNVNAVDPANASLGAQVIHYYYISAPSCGA